MAFDVELFDAQTNSNPLMVNRQKSRKPRTSAGFLMTLAINAVRATPNATALTRAVATKLRSILLSIKCCSEFICEKKKSDESKELLTNCLQQLLKKLSTELANNLFSN